MVDTASHGANPAGTVASTDQGGAPAQPAPGHKHSVMIYTRYERFWHWSQAALIFTLLFTGLAIHGSHGLLDFKTAVTVHTYGAIALIVLWVFTTFWNFMTGQWRQYLFKAGIWKVIRFYAYGILAGEPHPYKKRPAPQAECPAIAGLHGVHDRHRAGTVGHGDRLPRL